MKFHYPLLAVLLTLFVSVAAMAQPIWEPQLFCVKFTVHSATGDVSGTIKGLEGNLLIDSARPEKSWLTASVQTGTISTGNKLRDKHLRQADYFDATAYPRITLVSVGIEKNRADLYRGTFDLTLKGTTHRIDIPFTFTQIGNRCAFAGTFTLNRLDYKIGKSTMLLANRVTICLTIDGRLKADPVKSSDLAAQ